MAAHSQKVVLYRNILKELRKVYTKDKVQDSPAYQYVRSQFRDHSVTSERLCRSSIEMEYMGGTYLYYVQCTKQYDDLLKLYKGAGERTVQNTASMLGFKLPDVYDPNQNGTN